MREDAAALHVASALKPLAENVPNMVIEMTVPEDLVVADPERAHVLLRSVQEIITNAVRHANARNLWLSFERTEDSRLAIHARDDGRGVIQLKPGNGLTGMRERLSQFGGQLDIVTSRDQGFALDAWLPLEATP